MEYLWVAIGGALGSVARYWIGLQIVQRFGSAFPWGTLLVNVTGCFLIGFFAATTGPSGTRLTGSLRTFLMVGICGGYTTFSSFGLQTIELAQGGDWGRAVLYIVTSVLVCLLSVILGCWTAGLLTR